MTESTERLSSALADRYRILSRLGEGGMATVYLAEDLKHKRQVAVKVLKPELAAVLGAERFVQEITTTANLQHPHILPLFDSGEADSFLYYVMPFIDGETLRAKLDRETQLGIDESVKITSSVADALDYAHRQGVIHRDIKPENILLHDGRPMVADFGIALAVSAAAGGRMTETGLSLGTPHYMSPEQATAEKDLSNRSDIYSLGSVLYEMLTGDPPHTGSSAQQIVMKIIADEARPVSELRKSVPPNVAAAVGKSLEKLPADRFGSSSEFAEALATPGFATASSMQSLHAAGSPAGRIWRVPALAVMLVLMTAVAVWALLRPTPPQPVSRYSIVLPDGQQVGGGWARLALTPDGSRLIYVVEEGNHNALWIRDRDRLEVAELPGTDGSWAPFVSPDGHEVGFYVIGAIRAVPLSGGVPRTIVDTMVGGGTASWGNDGFVYFDTAGQGPIMRVPAPGGMPEQVTTLDAAGGEEDHHTPTVLPNGRGILFTIDYQEDDRTDIGFAETATGAHRVLVRGGSFPRYTSSGHLLYVSGGTLMAAPFDENSIEVTGEATAMITGVMWRGGRPPDIAIADDGTLMYTTGTEAGQTGQPVWVSRDGSVEIVAADWTDRATEVALSPDGTELAVSIEAPRERNIWVRRLEDGAVSKLTFAGLRNARPMWTDDGRAVSFLSNRGVNTDMYLRPRDGTSRAEILLDIPEALDEVHLTSNGEWVLYTVGRGNSRDILARRLSGDSTPVPIAVSDFREGGPAVSPDGRWVAYESYETGVQEVLVQSFPDAAGGKWSIGGGFDPKWARDGSELFYVNHDDELVAVEIRSDMVPPMGRERVLFSVAGYLDSGNYYDVAPDGQRFVFVRPSEQQFDSIELIVVENFFEELKAKVGE